MKDFFHFYLKFKIQHIWINLIVMLCVAFLTALVYWLYEIPVGHQQCMVVEFDDNDSIVSGNNTNIHSLLHLYAHLAE